MANRLTKEKMLEILERHETGEANGDLDAVMATVAAHPHFEFHPAGLILDSYEGVTELYRAALPGYVPMMKTAKQLNVWYNDTGCAVEVEFTFALPSGAPHRAQLFVILDFEDDLLKGERSYLDQEMSIHHRKLLGDDLLNVPGVRVSDGALPAA